MKAVYQTHIHELDQSIQSERNLFANLLNGLFTSIKNVLNAMKARRQMRPLLFATESELDDIGLTPEDIRFIRNSGYFVDHSEELARRVAARRN